MNHHRKLSKLVWVVALFTCCCANAQDTILVENTFSDSKQLFEKFYVLKSDRKTKHGPYIKYNRASEEDQKRIKKGELKPEYFTKDSGAFAFGKKSGYWKEYTGTNILKSEGSYKDGNKVGVWLTYVSNEVITQYDYDTNKKLPAKYILASVKYPNAAIEQGIEGIVTVSYQQNQDCSISNITIQKGLSPECDSSALEAVRRLDYLSRNYNVDCPDTPMTIDINFQLK